jgi:hypothetical protein
MVPYARAPYREGGDNISRLLMEQGRLRADSAQRSGDIWGQTVQSLGQQAGGAMEAHQMAKRDAALDAALKTWDGKDPRALFDSLKMLDPMSRAKVTEGMVGIMRLGQKDEAQERENWALAVKGAAALPYPVFAANWATIKERLGPGAQKYVGVAQLPDEADEQTYEMARQLAGQFGGKAPEAPKTRVVEVRNPDGSVTHKIVKDEAGQDFTSAPAPKAPPTAGSFEEYINAPLPRRREIEAARRGYSQADNAPPRPQVERVETINEAGQAVTQFVTPQPGQSYLKPTGGAGRPATGQQRKALSFFNRGKEAQEIASALEKGNEISPAAIKFTPDIANVLLSDQNQAYKQAQRAFTEARLRKESGAAVPQKEYDDDAITYFAQQGDGEAVKAQKRAMRNAVLAGIAFEAGDALKEFYGEEADGMLANYKATSRAPDAPGGQLRVNGGVDINAPPTVGRPKQIKNDAEYAALPSGTEYIAPDGSRRRKQ